jgi:hypothetical protein
MFILSKFSRRFLFGCVDVEVISAAALGSSDHIRLSGWVEPTGESSNQAWQAVLEMSTWADILKKTSLR